MELKKAAIAGTLESSDIHIMIEPNPHNGREISVDSVVKKTFGDAILATIEKVLDDFDVADAKITAVDKGALDFTIKARMECAVCRAAEIKYDWEREDQNGQD